MNCSLNSQLMQAGCSGTAQILLDTPLDLSSPKSTDQREFNSRRVVVANYPHKYSDILLTYPIQQESVSGSDAHEAIDCMVDEQQASSSTTKMQAWSASKKKRYICAHPNCNNKEFPQKSNFTAHQRVHSGERPYKCESCPKAFRQRAHLQQHNRTHTGEKPFSCGVCKRGFSNPSNMRVHLRTHSDVRPFQCEVCAVTFTQLAHLRGHAKRHRSINPNTQS